MSKLLNRFGLLLMVCIAESGFCETMSKDLDLVMTPRKAVIQEAGAYNCSGEIVPPPLLRFKAVQFGWHGDGTFRITAMFFHFRMDNSGQEVVYALSNIEIKALFESGNNDQATYSNFTFHRPGVITSFASCRILSAVQLMEPNSAGVSHGYGELVLEGESVTRLGRVERIKKSLSVEIVPN